MNFSVLTKSLRSGEKKGFLALYIFQVQPLRQWQVLHLHRQRQEFNLPGAFQRQFQTLDFSMHLVDVGCLPMPTFTSKIPTAFCFDVSFRLVSRNEATNTRHPELSLLTIWAGQPSPERNRCLSSEGENLTHTKTEHLRLISKVWQRQLPPGAGASFLFGVEKQLFRYQPDRSFPHLCDWFLEAKEENFCWFFSWLF